MPASAVASHSSMLGTSSSSSSDGVRKELLDVLSEVKTRVMDTVGSVDFPMPQFILIGKQSVGKSRIIETLAGETFNFVSGTLGSRRPTVLEFRNVPHSKQSKWSVLDKQSNRWQEHPVSRVMELLGEAHESLGASISDQPVNVKLESPSCVDMQIVDLPGFREFALDEEKQRLADAIERLVTRFMEDKRNVMLCVEQAGDAANLGTLNKCKKIDPNFDRTILIRNKLDKFYRDLTPENVNDWLEGFGDLPKNLEKFALTCPHWQEGLDQPPEGFSTLRAKMNEKDVQIINDLGVGDRLKETVGYAQFAKAMENRIEEMFADAIGPVLKKLREMKDSIQEKKSNMEEEISHTNPSQILNSVREAGMSFGHALNHVMEGYVRSDMGRITLEEELRQFHASYNRNGADKDFALLPSEDFQNIDDYITCLREELKVPAMDVEINGGAQFRRLMFEVEVFCRFAEICVETKKKDVIQARGVAMQSLTWRDVVVKLLSNEAHLPMKKRVRYVGERIKWFFQTQKDVIVDFMKSLKGSADEHMYSTLYSKTVAIIENNEMVKNLVYETFDRAVERQLSQFIELFDNTLASTFSNPWVFLKRASTQLDEGSLEDVCLPSFEDTKERIPSEIESRSGIDTILQKWLASIPQEPSMIDDAVDKAQMLLLKTFQFIRAQVADQIELFAESFFKLPMMRRLEEDMASIELSDMDREGHAARLEALQLEFDTVCQEFDAVGDSIEKLQTFALKAQSKLRSRKR
ncbi:unnamed protein product [Amoebophrya sp. A120]|nr:unnamed protein product [Amoebophrya sp. A120]|eukprot:GSA120T00006246001.1